MQEYTMLFLKQHIVPFEYSSGTSVKGRTRVSHFADKKMKYILHMAALSAIKHDAEIRTYYERKKTGRKTFPPDYK